MAFAQIDDYFLERLHLLTRNEIIVYSYLVKKRNDGTNKCNPKQITIAKETNLKTTRVSEAVKGLEAKGWAICDENGNYYLPSKVTDSVIKKVTESVSKSYGKRNKKLRNPYVEVTESVTKIKCIEKTIEKTTENTTEKKEGEVGAADASDFDRTSFGRRTGILAADLAAPIITLDQHLESCVKGMKLRLKTPHSLPKPDEWTDAFTFYHLNEYDALELLETFDTLDTIRALKQVDWQVSPTVIKNNIGKLESLKQELDRLENGEIQTYGKPNNAKKGNAEIVDEWRDYFANAEIQNADEISGDSGRYQ